MTGLAELQRAFRERLDFTAVDKAYLHRAIREETLGVIRGRDRIREAAMAEAAEEGPGAIRILSDLGDVLALETAGGWRAHIWAMHEGGRILREVFVIDRAARARSLGQDAEEEARRLGAMAPVHAPLGELRAGRGQLPAPNEPILSPDFPAEALEGARYLHHLWNRRDLSRLPTEWTGPADAGEARRLLLDLFKRLPDAELMIERGVAREDEVGILWRLHGHQTDGTRIRILGSSLLELQNGQVVAEAMLIDTLALAAAPHRPVIDYSR